MSPLMIPATIDMADVLGDGFSANQIPVWDGDGFVPMSDYQRKYTRTVVVDQGGKGDFTTVKAACDYVATQTRSTTLNWIVRVMPGQYIESPFSVPSYTMVLGDHKFIHSSIAITPTYVVPDATWASGNFITLSGNGATLAGIYISNSSVTPVGEIALVALAAGISGNIYGCNLNALFASAETYRCSVIKKVSGSGTTYVWNSAISATYGSGSATLGAHIFSEGGTGLFGIGYCSLVPTAGRSGVGILYGGSSASNFIAFTRIGSAAGVGFDNYDLQVTNGAAAFTINNTPIRKLSGTVAFLDRFFSAPAGIREATAADQCPTTSKGAASQSANLYEAQNSAAVVQWGVGPTGEQKTNQVSAGTTLGNVVGKEPVYDVSGTLVGYRPIYDAIT